MTKHNLQIQCDPYQNTNGIFHRTRTKKFHNSYGNTKDPQIAKAVLVKEEWSWRNQPFLISANTTKLQSSRQYDTGTKTEIQTNGTR